MKNIRSKLPLPLITGSVTFGLGVIGGIIIEFIQGRDFTAILIGKKSIGIQLISGVAYGLVAALVSSMLLRQRFMAQVSQKYILIGRLISGAPAIIFLSLSAGIGEEILFRGAIQYWTGIYLAAIIFVAIHGYLSVKNWPLTVYGFCQFLIVVPLGFAARYWGLIAPIVAHSLADIVVLSLLAKAASTIVR